MEQRTIDDLIRDMKCNLRDKRSTALLIGAGCSKEAGIPLASEFVQEIKKDFPDDYEQAENKASYAHCMGALRPVDRHALISKYIKNAKINRAHIAIAQLMKHDFVDRVLTTNFDSLVVRAGALSHLFPAVYDMAASPKFSPEMVGSKAVFHLHGQRDGFVQHHMPEQFKKLEGVLGPLFSDTNAGRTWVVVGYSGDNDPVFKQLEALHDFGDRLYWVIRGKDGPPQHVLDALSGKAAFWISASDADTFFYNLAHELGCLPPEFFDTPFTHLKSVFSTVADSKIPGGDGELPWLKHALEQIDQAIEQFEPPTAGGVLGDDTENAEPPYDVNDAMTDLMAGRVDDIVTRLDGREDLAEFAVPLSWAYVGQAEELKDSALSKAGVEADALFTQAYVKYAAALEIKPDSHEALNNWGAALSAQATQHTGAEAEALLVKACAKYAAALEIKPVSYKALNNWGSALLGQAKQHTGAHADDLFVQACAKYAAALEIKPDYHKALSNWGIALSDQAKQHTGAEAEALFVKASAKYAETLEIKPDSHDALYNWGVTLSDQAKQHTGAEADALLVKACAKYAATLEIKPDFHEALNNWGTALSSQAQQQTGKKKEALFAEAMAKYMQAEETVPGRASFNLACIAALRGEEKDCRMWLEKSWKAGVLPPLGHIQEDKELDFVRNKPWFKAFLKKVKDARNT